MGQKTRTVRTRVKKSGGTNKGGYMVCNICGGKGIVRKPKRRKK